MASIASAPTRETEGLGSRILLQEGDAAGSALTVTWVEVAPGASHSGRTAIRPSRSTSSSPDKDTCEQPLVHVSAATPPFSIGDLYDTGALSSGSKTE
ncbi:MAG: hypothetical protein ACR2GL_07305 [Thermoleophilaceae bacterium]